MAQTKYDLTQDETVRAEAQTAVNAAQQKVEEASLAVTQAEQQLQTAEQESTTAQELVQTAQTNYDTALQELADADAGAEITAEAEALREATDNAIAAAQQLSAAEAAVEVAQTVYNNAVNAKDTQETKVSELTTEVDSLKAVMDNANSTLSGAEAKLKELQEQQANIQGQNDAVSFFTYIGDEKAAAVLTACANNTLEHEDASACSSASSWLKLGDASSSTSIDNMIAAVKLVQVGNNIIEKDASKPALQIDGVSMAYAMLTADYDNFFVGSLEHIFSTPLVLVANGQPASTAQNIAWGWTDPYVGWYWEEKATYLNTTVTDLNGNTYSPTPGGQIGHYKNLASIDGDYYYTGFGHTSARYDAQNFTTNPVSDTTYTAAEFLKLLEEFKSGGDLTEQIEEAQKTVNTAKAAAQIATENYEAANSRLTAAKTALEEANTAVTNAQTKLDEAVSAQEHAQGAHNDAQQALSEAQSKYDEAVAKLEQEQQDAINTAINNLNTAVTALNEANEQAEQKQAAVAIADSNLSAAQAQQTIAEAELAEAENYLNSLDPETAYAALQSAQSTFNAAQTAYNTTKSALNDAKAELAAAEEALAALNESASGTGQGQKNQKDESLAVTGAVNTGLLLLVATVAVAGGVVAVAMKSRESQTR